MQIDRLNGLRTGTQLVLLFCFRFRFGDTMHNDGICINENGKMCGREERLNDAIHASTTNDWWSCLAGMLNTRMQ